MVLLAYCLLGSARRPVWSGPGDKGVGSEVMPSSRDSLATLPNLINIQSTVATG
jgi:hypothetical protein